MKKTINDFCNDVLDGKINGSVKQAYLIFLNEINHKNKQSAIANFQKYLTMAKKKRAYIEAGYKNAQGKWIKDS